MPRVAGHRAVYRCPFILSPIDVRERRPNDYILVSHALGPNLGPKDLGRNEVVTGYCREN
jgi:hypothetical protein